MPDTNSECFIEHCNTNKHYSGTQRMDVYRWKILWLYTKHNSPISFYPSLEKCVMFSCEGWPNTRNSHENLSHAILFTLFFLSEDNTLSVLTQSGQIKPNANENIMYEIRWRKTWGGRLWQSWVHYALLQCNSTEGWQQNHTAVISVHMDKDKHCLLPIST